jgi:hypothetical protein
VPAAQAASSVTAFPVNSRVSAIVGLFQVDCVLR